MKDILTFLCNQPSVIGFESDCIEAVKERFAPYFDESETDRFGNLVFKKYAEQKNAKTVLIDTHFDVVGLMVSEIPENGFLRFENLGGIDKRFLPSSEVTIYGKEPIYGVIVSTPPHLKKDGETNCALIDTGLSEKRVKELVSVGNKIDFIGKTTFCENGLVIGRGLDNKACCASALYALMNLPRESLRYHVILSLSAKEERGQNGAQLVAKRENPDLCIVADVNFASVPNLPRTQTIRRGHGIALDLSTLTNRERSRKIISYLEKNGQEVGQIVEPHSTATNNDALALCKEGFDTVVWSLPLASMHTPSESVFLSDMEAMARAFTTVLCAKEDLL